MFLRVIAAAAICAALLTTGASGGSVQVQLALTGGGTLSLTNNPVVSAGTQLTGQNQVLGYSLPLVVTDSRSTGAGWNITLTSSSFDDGAGHVLPPDASSIASTSVACVDSDGCTAPNNLINYPVPLPAGVPTPAAVKVFDADKDSGLGVFTVAPRVNVTIPGNARAGDYVSNVAVALVSGP